MNIRRLDMSGKLLAILALSCITSYAAAGTIALGTASAQGHMRVDGYTVNGDATVFNGSVVQTTDASAILRVSHGVKITMSKSSRGAVYDNHFVLQRGETEISAPASFELRANGLHVIANKPDSVGIVSLTPTNAVEVAAVNGSFEVRDGQGLLLSNVLPGRALSFAMQNQANIAPQFLTVAGMISQENGHYYLTSDDGVKYELIGKSFQKYVGDKVVVSGNFNPVALPGGAAGTITVKTSRLNGPGGGMTKTTKWMVTAVALGGAGEVGYVIHDALQPSASR